MKELEKTGNPQCWWWGGNATGTGISLKAELPEAEQSGFFCSEGGAAEQGMLKNTEAQRAYQQKGGYVVIRIHAP